MAGRATTVAATQHRDAAPTGWAKARRYLHEPIRAQDPAGRQAGVNRWRRTAGIWLVYVVYALVDLAGASLERIVLGAVLVTAFCYLYVVPLPRAMFGGPRRD